MPRLIALITLMWILAPGLNWAQTSVKTEKIGTPGHPFSKVMIVALNKMFENRKTVEEELTWWISDKGYNAFPYQKFNSSRELPVKDQIKAAIDSNNFDAVLISSVKDIQQKERYEHNPQGYYYSPLTPTFYNYLDTYNYIYSIGYTYNTKTYVVETLLFDIASEQPVLRITSSTYEDVELDKAIESYAKALSKALMKSKMLAKKEKK
jgi:hypothetical protein